MPLPVLPDVGKTSIMNIVMNAIQSGGMTSEVVLFTNNYFPSSGSTLGAFVDAANTGCTFQSLPAATDQGVIPGSYDLWNFATLTYVADASVLPETYYGYYVRFQDPILAATALLWAQRFDVPQTVTAAGNQVQFTLGLQDNYG